ncbi:MAG: hypothetical protein ACXWL5_00170 [Candidatus Chromulinivorax sp.]
MKKQKYIFLASVLLLTTNFSSADPKTIEVTIPQTIFFKFEDLIKGRYQSPEYNEEQFQKYTELLGQSIRNKTNSFYNHIAQDIAYDRTDTIPQSLYDDSKKTLENDEYVEITFDTGIHYAIEKLSNLFNLTPDAKSEFEKILLNSEKLNAEQLQMHIEKFNEYCKKRDEIYLSELEKLPHVEDFGGSAGRINPFKTNNTTSLTKQFKAYKKARNVANEEMTKKDWFNSTAK